MPKRDLTTCSILLGVLSLALPTIGSSILHSIQSLVDMFFVGELGPEALAAVGMSGTVMMILATVFMGINISTAAMVSRAIGAGDETHANHVASQSFALTVLFSGLVGAAGYLGAPHILAALGAEPEVVDLGSGYLRIVFPGIFFMCASFVISGILHAAGDAITPLLLGILATAINVILNPLLIFGYLGFPALGVRGSAVATVIARAIALGVGVFHLLRGRLRVRLSLRGMRPVFRSMWRILAWGVPSSLQMSIRTIMSLVLMAIVARFGTDVVAAYTVGLRIRMVGLFPVFGFAASAATMVGQNLGAGKPDRSQRSALTAAAVSFVAISSAALVFFVFARPLTGIFNDDPAVVSAGARFLRYTALGLCTASIGIVLSRSLNGAGDTVSPLVITLVMLWGFQVPAAIYLSGVTEIGSVAIPFTGYFESVATHDETGIWYAMVASSILQTIAISAWFATGRWKRIRLGVPGKEVPPLATGDAG